MSDNLVERLRTYRTSGLPRAHPRICDTAADEIDRLNAEVTELRSHGLPEYDATVADVFQDYLKELVGWEGVRSWAHLPATWRWHEFWERLEAALRAKQ